MAAGDILPQPEVCGHCHEAKNVEMQGQHLFCFDCGKGLLRGQVCNCTTGSTVDCT